MSSPLAILILIVLIATSAMGLPLIVYLVRAVKKRNDDGIVPQEKNRIPQCMV